MAKLEGKLTPELIKTIIGEEKPDLFTNKQTKRVLGGISSNYPIVQRNWTQTSSQTNSIRINLDRTRYLSVNVESNQLVTSENPNRASFHNSALIIYTDRHGENEQYRSTNGTFDDYSGEQEHSHNNPRAIRKLRRSKTAMNALNEEVERNPSLRPALTDLLK